MTINTDSTLNKYSRYVWGGITERSSDRLEWWERINLDYDVTDDKYVIEAIYSGLNYSKLANAIYGNPALGIFILQFNNILDPLTEFTTGKTILLPKYDRVMTYINSGILGGTDTQRIYKV
jgi:hypothetical protein